MKKKTKQKIFTYKCIKVLSIGWLCLILVAKSSVLAIASESKGDPLGFSVETVKPSTQIDQNKTFFYIKTEPNQVQKLKVKVTGTSADVVKVKVYLANGITSEKATINYLASQKKDETLKNSIEEIATVNQPEIEVAPGETKEVVINVKPPAENYAGIKLGSIYFQRETEKDSKVTVDSSFSYRIGLVTSEEVGSYNNGQSLKLLDVQPELLRAKKTIGVTLQNPEPKVIPDFAMKVEIVNKKDGNIVKKQSTSDGSIAPNSHFTYSVDWGLDPIPSGTYIAKIHAKSNDQIWNLEKEFTITEEKAKAMNDETAFKLTLPNWFYVLTIVLSLATLTVSVYLIYRGRQWQQQLSEAKRRNKRRPKKAERK